MAATRFQSSGSRLVSVSIQSTDILRLISWVGQLDEVLAGREKWTRTVRTLGLYIDEAFASEGASLTGRRWQGLSQMTREKRRGMGLNPDHPILQQRGSLRKTAAGNLTGWIHGSAGFTKRGVGVGMVASLTGSQFEATISGPKVENNFGSMGRPAEKGDPRVGAGFLPARPFFYIDTRMNPIMANQMAESIMSQWQSKGKGATRTHGRMSILPMGGSRRQAITTSW